MARQAKSLLINPRFQLTFLGYMIGFSALTIAIFYSANFYFFWKFKKIGESVGLTPDHIFFQFLNEQQATMNIVFLVTAVIAFAGLFLGGLFLSHRVAGPLYRLNNHMADVADGKTSNDVSFRKKDYFPELADSYNRQLKALKSGNPESGGDSNVA